MNAGRQSRKTPRGDCRRRRYGAPPSAPSNDIMAVVPSMPFAAEARDLVRAARIFTSGSKNRQNAP